MIIKKATKEDAPIIYALMQAAYEEYRYLPGRSTALDETIESIEHTFEQSECGLIAFIENEPVATVRYHFQEDELFFSRLSVHPSNRGQGLARRLIQELETIAKQAGRGYISCKVRMDITRNLEMYYSYGYHLTEHFTEVFSGIEMEIGKVKKNLNETR